MKKGIDDSTSDTTADIHEDGEPEHIDVEDTIEIEESPEEFADGNLTLPDDALLSEETNNEFEAPPPENEFSDKDIETENADSDDTLNDDLADEEKEPDDDIIDVSSVSEIADVESIQGWIGEVNPNYDPFDLSSAYANNCGSCAYAVYKRIEGDTNITATADNISTVEEMNEITGMEQVPMSPDEIEEYLISQGPGAQGIVGIDRTEGPGHWFNAYYDGKKVIAVDGQTGETQDWPPDYGDVTNWDISVKKENDQNE